MNINTEKYFKNLDNLEEWKESHLNLNESIPSPIYCGYSNKKMISIMINVAWGNEYLVELLKVLNENKVKATFFLDGSWVHKYPLLGKRILDDGHEIGNHAYSHPDMRGLTMERIEWQLKKTNEAITKELGVKPKFFTPPSGEFDERVVYLAAKEKMITVLSTIDTLDWQKPKPKDIVEKIKLNLKNGALILIHPTESSLLSLPEIINMAREENYEISTVSDLLSETDLIDAKQGTIYVDGQPVEVNYLIKDDDIMVPAYFFKHAGVKVDFNFKNNKVVLSNNNKIEEINSINKGNYISLHPAVKLLEMNIFYDPKTLKIYLITNTSPQQKTKILFKCDTLEKKVALTFNGGPDNYNTPKILDILNDKGVKATFFVVGDQINIFPEVLKRIVKEGHEIGNNTWSHTNLTKLLTNEVIKEVTKTEEIIKSITGIETNIFRPPFGSLADSDLSVIDSLGLKVVNWNIDTVDYEGTSANKIIDKVKMEISPGSIILQHSFQDSTGVLDGTISALPIIIDQLRSEGMEFVTIEELMSRK